MLFRRNDFLSGNLRLLSVHPKEYNERKSGKNLDDETH